MFIKFCPCRPLAILALIVLAACDPQAPAAEGRAQVTDGDTLTVAGEKVRLHGIDAPEMKQTCDRDGRAWACGTWARDMLRALVRQGPVRCVETDRDRYGRMVAVCYAGENDIGAQMVRLGAARAYLQYSHDYVGLEKQAALDEAGLWSTSFENPWDWRARPALSASAPAPEGCPIKGNISKSGQIYHMPGQADYHRTSINTSRGERWFCSEAEAMAAGWRRARR
ncbi:thermonuclease family protein [Poseidonocella sedimentorum]|uniref:Endonuclease YncB, thermonuclease family n=1 Tax=Poseidonocella sedimentorum TaxID=871652 RepID=A0A1I6CSQ5_9RHOB|nr:thermonuclease family protein [Poseidonocella sedimentorum]SFQ96256.1 Endonuclease YncB, thermonuclease family [Poseidonocella sedimentorum]